MTEPLLRVQGVSMDFPLRGGGVLHAVRDVSFSLANGETLGIVGESGSGKSTLARMLLHLAPPTAGAVIMAGIALAGLSAAALRRQRRHMQMVFQDPMAALDSRMCVGDIIAEPLHIHGIGTKQSRAARVAELCAMVGLPAAALQRFPHEFSGGQRQRISIARALAPSPTLLVLDEPVSALDVSIQAQILNLLVQIRQDLALSYVFISHDLAVIRHVSDRIAVMYLGQIVETGPAEAVLRRPRHPYAELLLSAVLEPGSRHTAAAPKGEPANPADPPSGCAFHPRCPRASARCAAEYPPPATLDAQEFRCWHPAV